MFSLGSFFNHAAFNVWVCVFVGRKSRLEDERTEGGSGKREMIEDRRREKKWDKKTDVSSLSINCQPYFPHHCVCVYTFVSSVWKTSIRWTPISVTYHKRSVCVCVCDCALRPLLTEEWPELWEDSRGQGQLCLCVCVCFWGKTGVPQCLYWHSIRLLFALPHVYWQMRGGWRIQVKRGRKKEDKYGFG